jgi:hypothetical protein
MDTFIVDGDKKYLVLQADRNGRVTSMIELKDAEFEDIVEEPIKEEPPQTTEIHS